MQITTSQAFLSPPQQVSLETTVSQNQPFERYYSRMVHVRVSNHQRGGVARPDIRGQRPRTFIQWFHEADRDDVVHPPS